MRTVKTRDTACIFFVSWLLLAICASVLSRGYTLSSDEVQNIDQAERFARGMLTSTIPKGGFADVGFTEPQTASIGNRQTSKYPPGFSLILSIGSMIGKPEWVNPAIAAAGLTIFYAILKSFIGIKWSLIATICLGLNPIYWGYAQSYYPHSLANTLILLLIWFLLHPRLRDSRVLQAGVGAAFLFLVITRLPDAACALFSLSLFAYMTRTRWFAIPAFTGFFAGIASLCFYNLLITGTLILSLYGQKDLTILGLFKGDYEPVTYMHWYLDGLSLRTGTLLREWYFCYCGYLYPVVGVIGIGYGCLFFKKLSGLLLLISSTILVFYTFVPYMGYPFWGMRYQSFLVIALGGFAILPFWWIEKKYSTALAIYASLMMAVWQVFVAEQHFSGYRARYDYTESIYKAIANQCQDKTLALFVQNPSAERYFVEMSLTRTYRDDLPVVGAPALTNSHKTIHVLFLHRQDIPIVIESKGKRFSICIPQYPSSKEFISNINASQKYFLSFFDGDNKSWP